jgi:hypothetical protein
MGAEPQTAAGATQPKTTATSTEQALADKVKLPLSIAQSQSEKGTGTTQAVNPEILQKVNRYSNEGSTNRLISRSADGKVTSVSELSDVQPTDWAFQALQSLVERYGCIAGYPDGTFRGNRALTRYEFAAGLNACMDKISELIAANTANLVTKSDLATLQKLQEQFAAELATLRGRVDALEARTAELEANQFSTTTKLQGEAIFAATQDFGGNRDKIAAGTPRLRRNTNNTVFQERVRLNFNTSFTGKDVLQTRLQVGNADVQVGSSKNFPPPGAEGFQTFNVGASGNVFKLDTLEYRFPFGDRLDVAIAANNGTFDDFTPTQNPYFEDYDGGNGSLSTFGQRNPIYRIGGGQGIGVNLKFGRGGSILRPSSLTLGYLADQGNNPGTGTGLFNGSYAGLAQLNFSVGDAITLAATYVHGYHTNTSESIFDNGGGSAVVGTASANLANPSNSGNPIQNSILFTGNGSKFFAGNKSLVTNSYGVSGALRLSPKFVLTAWGSQTSVRILGRGDGSIWTYALGLAFPDLGKKGNVGGIVVGIEPYLAGLQRGNSGKQVGIRRDLPLHVEGFYKFQVSDNISITPGVIWVDSPDQNTRNDSLVIGTLRTTFTF